MGSFYNMVLKKLEEISDLEHNLKPCVDIFKRYSYNINTFCTYNFSDYLYMLYIGAYLDDFTYHIKIIDKYKENFDRIKSDDLDRLIELYNTILISLKDNRSLIISDDCYLNQVEEFEKKPFSKDLKMFFKKICTDKEDKMDFEFYNIFMKDFLNENDRSIFFGIVEIYKIKYIKEYSIKVKVDKEKIAQKTMKKYGDVAYKVLELVQGTKNNIEGEYNSFQRLKNKQMNLYKNLLNDIRTNEYIDIEKYRKLLDPDILLELLFYNSKFYTDDYDEENSKFINQETDKLEEFLLKENINVDISKINVSYEEVIDKISILSKTNLLKYNNITLHILNNISLNNLTKIINFMNEKIYDEEFLLDNILEFKNNDILSNFINNVLVLLYNGISVYNVLKYDKNILFSDNKKIQCLLNLYKKYNINLKGECYNFEWLSNDMSYIIDGFIEIGQHKLICNNLSLLNSNSNIIIKRCILYMNLNNEIINEQGKLKGSLRKEENYILSDNVLNETILTNYDLFIPNDVVLELKSGISNFNLYEIDSIKDYMIDDNTFKFGNILISKYKIFKNLNILHNSVVIKNYSDKELLLFSIIYNYPILLTKEDINSLRKVLNIKTKTLKIN